jgi:hypothetical protein
MSGIAFFVAATALGAANATEQNPAKMPDDVAGFAGRRVSCEERAAKAKSNPETAAESSKVQQSLSCDAVPRDGETLREKYRSDPVASAALSAEWVRVVQRPSVTLPEQAAPNPPSSEAR